MFETFGFEETTAKQASVLFALILGAIFGALAERTGFCFRRAVVGEDRRSAAGVWMMALAVAVIGTQWLVSAELISFDEHRFMSSDFPVLAVILGGVMFGIGMVLTRGCVSRLTVLGGTGNLRALLVLLVFAVVAHAMLKGVLAPLRVALGSVTVDLGSSVSLATLPGGAWLYAGAGIVAAGDSTRNAAIGDRADLFAIIERVRRRWRMRLLADALLWLLLLSTTTILLASWGLFINLMASFLSFFSGICSNFSE